MIGTSQEQLKKMGFGSQDFTEPLKTPEEPFKKPKEKLKVIEHIRKQSKPTKVNVTKKPKRASKKLKQETTLVADLMEHTDKPKREDVTDSEVDQFLEHTEVMITDQELADVTDALVKSSERFDQLMAYYDTMPEKIDGPVDLAWLETHVAPEKERFDQLMHYYVTEYPWHIDGKVDLTFLETHVVRMLKEGIVRFMIKEQNSACL